MGRRKRADRIGEKYKTSEGYTLEIIDYEDVNNCSVKIDNDIIIHNLQYHNIIKRSVRNPYHPSVCGIGYLGIGEYVARKEKVKTKEYLVWISMIKRCYDNRYHEKQPTYKDVTVCEEWHNFQNFAKWFEENYVEGWHLDKDILVKGNKIYSPETCCFVPRNINMLFTHRSKNIYYEKCKKKYTASLNKKRIGSYETPEEAFQAYKEAKEKYIKEVADKWKDKISDKVYKAMYSYTIKSQGYEDKTVKKRN